MDFLQQLLQAVIIAAVPVITGAIVGGARRLAEYLKNRQQNEDEHAQNEATSLLIDETERAITTAVSYTSQKFVDALKAANAFNADNQEEAARKALVLCKNLLSTAAQQFLIDEYGAIDIYLQARIEAEVRAQKQAAEAAKNAAATVNVNTFTDSSTPGAD